MFLLPNFLPIEEGESLLSYTVKSHLVNRGSFPDFCASFFPPELFSNSPISRNFHLLDTRRKAHCHYSEQFLGGIAWQLQIPVPDLFLNHSPLALLFPLLTRKEQGFTVNDLFNSYRSVIRKRPVKSMISSIRICPECARKDMDRQGFFNLYAIHQIPFIGCCPVHHCRLIETDYLDPCTVPEDSGTGKCTEAEIRFSEFCASFLRRPNCLDHLTACTGRLLCSLGLEDIRKRADFVRELQTRWQIRCTENQLLSVISCPKSARYSCSPLLALKLAWVLTELGFSVCSDESPFDNFEAAFNDALEEGWEIEAYSPYVAQIRNRKDGKVLWVSPDQVISGWPLPCPDISPQKLAGSIIYGISSGEYELVSDFTRLSTPIVIRHNVCGTEFTCYFRSFVYGGLRCRCEKSSPEAVQYEVEKDGEFRFLGIEDPETMTIRVFHYQCGQTGVVQYEKFRRRHRCPACSVEHMTEKSFIEIIKVLAGEEYSYISGFVNASTQVLMRHHTCGNTFFIKPKDFTEGKRCPYCLKPVLSSDLFTRIVSALSQGRYEVIPEGRTTAARWAVQDNVTGKIRILKKNQILQELTRPTPSVLLPLSSECRLSSTQRSSLLKEMPHSYREYAERKAREEGFITAEDLICAGMEKGGAVGCLAVMAGKGVLKRAGPGLYAHHTFVFRPIDVIRRLYIGQNGNRKGYYCGPAFIWSLGFSDIPDCLDIRTNARGRHCPKSVQIMGQSLRLHRSRTAVTGSNYIVLSILDFLDGDWPLAPEKLCGLIISSQLSFEDFSGYFSLFSDKARIRLKSLFESEVLYDPPY